MTIVLILIILVVLGGAITLIVIGMRETRAMIHCKIGWLSMPCVDNQRRWKRLSYPSR